MFHSERKIIGKCGRFRKREVIENGRRPQFPYKKRDGSGQSEIKKKVYDAAKATEKTVQPTNTDDMRVAIASGCRLRWLSSAAVHTANLVHGLRAENWINAEHLHKGFY